MRLGIDLDGVVAAFNDGWMKIHNEEFGGSLRSEMVTSWNALDALGGFADMDAFWEWARPNEHRQSVFRHLELFPGALETLGGLSAAGHEIVILTSKPDWAVPDTLHWLADRRIPTREVHFVYDKHEVDCDVYLDDAPIVLPGLVRHRAHAVVCRFVRPWNDPLEGVRDVANWSEFHDVVTEQPRH